MLANFFSFWGKIQRKKLIFIIWFIYFKCKCISSFISKFEYNHEWKSHSPRKYWITRRAKNEVNIGQYLQYDNLGCWFNKNRWKECYACINWWFNWWIKIEFQSHPGRTSVIVNCVKWPRTLPFCIMTTTLLIALDKGKSNEVKVIEAAAEHIHSRLIHCPKSFRWNWIWQKTIS